MQFPDLVNGSFEFFAGFFSYQNVKAIRRDRGYAGVHWVANAFFTSWGAWNLYYYPHLDQWLSFFGGLSIFGVNITWLYYALTYGPIGSCPSSRPRAFEALRSQLRKHWKSNDPASSSPSPTCRVEQASYSPSFGDLSALND